MQLIDTKAIAEQDFPEVRVNNILIQESDIVAEMQYHPAEELEEARYQAAQALVVKELLLQKAKLMDISAPEQESVSNDEAMISALLSQEVKQPDADEDACFQYFKANPEKFRSPDLIAASHILLGADPEDPEERHSRKEQAEALIKQLQEHPDSFAELAQQHSDCPSKELGGQLGQLDKGSTVPEFERQVFPLPEGLCPNPIESRYGYHIARVDKRVDGDPLEYEMVMDKIRTYLQEQVYRRSVNQYISMLAGSAEIEGVELHGADSMLVQ
ncbi:MAG: peptidylprolyl isomerase [Amphritea sp.]